ncbi:MULTISPECIES: DinI-like family protein [Aeromonas]|uniref:DinI-like family protein n=1 Tax=Aeromonas dhakensis TaxID=196024 RepID=UPI0013967BCA|nr:DinI-like family protein [Aeromonas dhakensis]
MILRIIIDKKQKLPNGTTEALQKEAARRLLTRWPELVIDVIRGQRNDVEVKRTTAEERDAILEVVQEVWEDPDSWMPAT